MRLDEKSKNQKELEKLNDRFAHMIKTLVNRPKQKYILCVCLKTTKGIIKTRDLNVDSKIHAKQVRDYIIKSYSTAYDLLNMQDRYKPTFELWGPDSQYGDLFGNVKHRI